MITSEIGETKSRPNYPYLGVIGGGQQGQKVVLFIKANTGVVVSNTYADVHDPVGFYINCWDEKAFARFNASVTLSNA